MTDHQYISQLGASLNLAGLEQSPSEVHGMLFGSIANHMYSGQAPNLLGLLTGLEQQDPSMNHLHELLNELYRETSEMLLDSDDEVSLMLVDEDAKLVDRADSLADWCRGYLLGLLQSEKVSIDQLPEDGPEVARDILAISEASYSESEDEHQEEWAFAELEEYIKVGVRLIFESIVRLRSGESTAGSPPPVQ